ncbi:MAG: zinc metallopeptidase [Ruminococcaceae bacterium]|nr:zinc metallopeptidase [Oscillospiraceae bacterium]
MPFYYGFDYTYIIYVLPALLFALWAQFNVKSTFNKFSRVASERGMTGYDAARLILDRNGLRDVKIEMTAGNLTDHYDPKANVIRLSESVHSVASVAAVGVAAHEAGHAVQHAEGYFPIKIRTAIIPITNIGSNLAFPLVLLGLLFSAPFLAGIGVILFGAAVLFQLVTLPVEFNASSRAIEALEMSGISDEAVRDAKKVLRAAALTYVAALATAIGNFLRLLAIANRSRRN